MLLKGEGLVANIFWFCSPSFWSVWRNWRLHTVLSLTFRARVWQPHVQIWLEHWVQVEEVLLCTLRATTIWLQRLCSTSICFWSHIYYGPADARLWPWLHNNTFSRIFKSKRWFRWLAKARVCCFAEGIGQCVIPCFSLSSFSHLAGVACRLSFTLNARAIHHRRLLQSTSEQTMAKEEQYWCWSGAERPNKWPQLKKRWLLWHPGNAGDSYIFANCRRFHQKLLNSQMEDLKEWPKKSVLFSDLRSPHWHNVGLQRSTANLYSVYTCEATNQTW